MHLFSVIRPSSSFSLSLSLTWRRVRSRDETCTGKKPMKGCHSSPSSSPLSYLPVTGVWKVSVERTHIHTQIIFLLLSHELQPNDDNNDDPGLPSPQTCQAIQIERITCPWEGYEAPEEPRFSQLPFSFIASSDREAFQSG